MSYDRYGNDRARERSETYGVDGPDRSRRGNASHTVANVVSVVTGLVALVFGLHVIFSLADANQGNGFVRFVYDLARVLVLGFGDVFTPDDAKIGLVLNYGLAALVYLVVGQLIARALRR